MTCLSYIRSYHIYGHTNLFDKHKLVCALFKCSLQPSCVSNRAMYSKLWALLAACVSNRALYQKLWARMATCNTPGPP